MTRVPRALGNRDRDAAFLCYHSVAPSGPEFLTISPEQFERQLAHLRAAGWTTGDGAALAELARGARPTQPTAFLTFDDGYVDNHDVVLPLLREYGARALVFVLPRHVDEAAPLRWEGVEESCERFPAVMRSMGWTQVEALVEAGCSIGAHTLTHPRLDLIGDEQLGQELLDSRRRVAERLGRCDSIAYPYGSWDARVHAAAKAAGYRWAFTLPRTGQLAVDALSIPRIAIDHRDSERRFAAKLRPLTRRALLSPRRTAVQRPLRAAQRALGSAR